jgi:CRP/FNR family transcriptional regulator, cyclic AMP receptor protein
MSVLASTKMFANVPRECLDDLERRSISLEFNNGAQIFAEGDPADAVYAMIGGEGRVRIGSIDRRGKALMVEVFGVGDTFGEIGVIDGGMRTAGAWADGRVRLSRLPASLFLELLYQIPTLGANVSKLLAIRLRRTFALFEDASFESLEVRLARQVLYLAKNYGHDTEHGVRLAGRFRQPDLADLLGATPRSIISILNRWRAEGLVILDTTRGQMTLCSEKRLWLLLKTAETIE